MVGDDNLRVAWLFPSLRFANYWHPVLSQFAKLYQQTIVYTGVWPGFSPGYEDTFQVEVVGEMKYVEGNPTTSGYGQGFIYVSPGIITPLLKFRPQVIFTTGFSIWTLLVLLFKPIGGWRVIIAYEGSAPGVNFRSSRLRTTVRRWMTQVTDAFITNSQAGKDYLLEVLGVKEHRIFARPYEVPDETALLKRLEGATSKPLPQRRPVFLFTGQLIPRKGLRQLLEACQILHQQGYDHYTLLVAGDGELRAELEEYSKAQGLADCVEWLGWVSYGELGAYFQSADAFILPTLEDTWGMVVLEAMAFGQPILCSQWAGASELVIEGKNGYLFDPYDPEATAKVMRFVIDHPELLPAMGQASKYLIANHTPVTAAQFLAQVTDRVFQDVYETASL